VAIGESNGGTIDSLGAGKRKDITFGRAMEDRSVPRKNGERQGEEASWKKRASLGTTDLWSKMFEEK